MSQYKLFNITQDIHIFSFGQKHLNLIKALNLIYTLPKTQGIEGQAKTTKNQADIYRRQAIF